MSCQHAKTTTLLWLYGEGPEDHVSHIAQCDECQAVTEEHSELMATIGPVIPALRRAEPMRRRRWWIGGTVVALAAAAALMLRFVVVSPTVEPEVVATNDTDSNVEKYVEADLVFFDTLDWGLDDLDDELEALSQDLMNL
ncbi:MAG: hypothetical protein HN348_04320 [Proteobacteria bacterium]|jgi:hypothetical protein|nr:hypothetical protein [Pseudomonadota bacterium]